MNIFALLIQLVIELIRTALIDELAERCRRRTSRWLFRRSRKHLNVADRIQLRVRKRLFHRLTTGERQKL